MTDTITPTQARQLLQEEQQARVDECRRGIDALLQKHRCRLDVFVILRAGQVAPQVQIVAET